MPEVVAIGASLGYDGIELRFVEGEDSLWKLPAFKGSQLASTKRSLADCGLVISCVDTSCRFHFPEAAERNRWLEEGKRMSDLAAALEAPGLRVFGDTIQPGAYRDSTCTWIAESISALAEVASGKGVEVWLESHGDFARSSETLAVLQRAHSPKVGILWDPANCFVEAGERPAVGATLLGPTIRHTHIKDLRKKNGKWEHVLIGEGSFPVREQLGALRDIGYNGFVSFEWEKKWHPEIADAEIALPHFVQWFRQN
jgi:sugar phosphate isomerase/epimerase